MQALKNKILNGGKEMLRADKRWCRYCRERTVHNYVGSKSGYEGLGLARAIIAVASLGTSETICRSKYWQCSECGEITED